MEADFCFKAMEEAVARNSKRQTTDRQQGVNSPRVNRLATFSLRTLFPSTTGGQGETACSSSGNGISSNQEEA
jgi:hypothetical protein